MKKIFIHLIAMIALLSGSLTQAADHILALHNEEEPRSLDPATGFSDVENQVITNLFDGLTEYDPKDNHPIPAGAESWKISADGRTYTFHLRKNAKWSDGSPVTAQDYEYGLKRLLNPKTASEYAFILYYVKNGQAYNEGKIKDPKQVGIKTLNKETLQITLNAPTPFFLTICALFTVKPAKQSVVEKFGENWALPEHIVTNGAYKLKEWIPQKAITLVKNPNYWDAARAKIQEVKFYPTADRETAIKMYESGEIDTVKRLPGIRVPELQKRPDFHVYPQNAVFYFSMNNKKSPFDNPKVRQAFSMSIDRKAITDFIMKAGEKPSGSFVPSGMPEYKSVYEVPYDPVKAKQLLTEAGYGDPSKLPPIEMIYNTDQMYQQIVQAVQQMWKKNLGINITLRNMDWKTLVKTRMMGDFQLARDRWIGDYLDPNTYLEIFLTGSPMDYAGYSNKQFDALVAQAGKEADPANRMALMAQAEKILLEEAGLIPVATYTTTYLVKPQLKGFYGNLIDSHLVKYMSWEE